jgi:hypothetical protein
MDSTKNLDFKFVNTRATELSGKATHSEILLWKDMDEVLKKIVEI